MRISVFHDWSITKDPVRRKRKLGENCTDLNYMIEMMEQLESRIFHSITKIGRDP